jgi:hypothetical protein
LIGALAALITLVSASFSASPKTVFASTSTLVAYQGTGYKYQEVLSGQEPVGWQSSSYDDSSWAAGDAAFGSGGGCPLQPTVKTHWDTNTDMLLRKSIALPAGATAITVGIAIDNNAFVYWNGAQVGSAVHGGCPAYNDYVFSVPDNLVLSGNNILAVQAIDLGVESFVDVTVSGTVNPAPSITSVSPAWAAFTGGTSVTITGANLGTNPQVAFHSPCIPVGGGCFFSFNDVAPITSLTSTSITVTVPGISLYDAALGGPATIEVTASPGLSATHAFVFVVPEIGTVIFHQPVAETGQGSNVTFTSNTLRDSSKQWQTNHWAGDTVTVGNQHATVTSNTPTTLTLAANWSKTPKAGGSYNIDSFDSCTGEAVQSRSHRLILTAGHCVTAGGGTNEDFAFAPGYFGSLCSPTNPSTTTSSQYLNCAATGSNCSTSGPCAPYGIWCADGSLSTPGRPTKDSGCGDTTGSAAAYSQHFDDSCSTSPLTGCHLYDFGYINTQTKAGLSVGQAIGGGLDINFRWCTLGPLCNTPAFNQGLDAGWHIFAYTNGYLFTCVAASTWNGGTNKAASIQIPNGGNPACSFVVSGASGGPWINSTKFAYGIGADNDTAPDPPNSAGMVTGTYMGGEAERLWRQMEACGSNCQSGGL